MDGEAEHPVEPAELADLLGVHPELVQQVDQRHHHEHFQRHAGDRHRQVENPAQQHAAAGLAQGGGQVVVLALVMHHVRGPQDVHLVPQPVQPVVAEVVEDDGQSPTPTSACGQGAKRHVLGRRERRCPRS